MTGVRGRSWRAVGVAAAVAALGLLAVGRIGRIDDPRAVGLPEADGAVAEVLADRTPVLVVRDGHEVRAFDARLPPRGPLPLPRLAAWCETSAVAVDAHGARVYDPHGRAVVDVMLVGGRGYGSIGHRFAPAGARGLVPLAVEQVTGDGRLARLGPAGERPRGPPGERELRALRDQVLGRQPVSGEGVAGPLPCWPPRPESPTSAHRTPRWPDPAQLVAHDEGWPGGAVTPEALAAAGNVAARLVSGSVVRLPGEPARACAHVEGEDPPRCPAGSPEVAGLAPLRDDGGFTRLHGRFLAGAKDGRLVGVTLLAGTRVDGSASGQVAVTRGRFRGFGRRFGDAVEVLPDDPRDPVARRCALGRSTDGSLALPAAERPLVYGRERLAGSPEPVRLDKDALAELLVPGAEEGAAVEVRLDPVTCEAWRLEELP